MSNIRALYARGIVFHNANRLAEAVACYDEALAQKPDYAEAFYSRGIALWGLRRFEEGLASTDRALEIRPYYAEAWYNRGVMLQSLGRFEEALASFDMAIMLKPDFVEALNNRGGALRELKRLNEALESFEQVLRVKPDHAGALNNRGGILLQSRYHEEALANFDAALAINPCYADALYNRGIALQNLDRIEEALASFEAALSSDPCHANAFGSIAGAAMHICDWKRTTIILDGIRTHIASGKAIIEPLTMMAYCEDPALQRRCAENYTNYHVPGRPQPLWHGRAYRHDRIRVAYLSADLWQHATAILMAELFERHDRSRFEVLAISFGEDDRSAMRARLVNAFDGFHDVHAQSDEAAAKLVRSLEVDIAVDLKGHTKDARPGILSYRPAPVQASFLGYPGTMGADFIDYVIADGIIVPFDQQPFFTEKIIHLPDSYQPNDSRRVIADHKPTRAEVGLPERSFVFCSFNSHWKITPSVFDIWMRLLTGVPESVLWLIGSKEHAQHNLRAEAGARGIDAARLIFSKKLTPEDHLARHRLADLFLDTLPINAHTTASDALWAGLPLITCRGKTFAGRVAASLLYAVGLPELVTANLEEYENLALKLARNPMLLRSIRKKLAECCSSAPLFNTDRFQRHIESAYTTMWKISENGEPPKSFAVEP